MPSDTKCLLWKKAVEIAQAQLLLSDEQVAARMGIPSKIYRRYRHSGFPSPYLRARCEACLDYAPIWNPIAVVEVRRRCQETLGYDPALLSIRELRGRCRERGLPASESTKLSDLIASFIAHLTVNPPKPTLSHASNS